MRDWTRQDGFSLVEVLIASTVLALVMVGALTLVAGNHDAYRRGTTIAETHQHARVSVQRMDRELRMAGYDLSGVLDTLPSATPIQTAETTEIAFVADVTGDGVLDQVTYRQNGSDLVRELWSWDGKQFTAATTGEVASNVELLTFSYFDDTTPDNNAIAAPVPVADLGTIRRVTISLVTTAEMTNSRHSFPIVTDVRLRN